MFSRSRLRRLLGLCLSSLMLCFCLSRVGIAQAVNPAQWVEQGVQRYRAGAYQAAVDLWQKALETYQNEPAKAVLVQTNLARAQQQLGQSDAAIASWERVTAYYDQTKNLKALGRSLTEQAQVYSSLGQSRKAIALLCGQETQAKLLKPVKGQKNPVLDLSACLPASAVGLARTTKDDNTKDATGEAAALGSLGDAYRLRGNYEVAIALLESGLAVTPETPAYAIAVRYSLGNAYSSRAQVSYRRAESAGQRGDPDGVKHYRALGFKDDAQALAYFQDSLQRAEKQTDLTGEVRSLISAIPAYYRLASAQSQKDLPDPLQKLISTRLAYYPSNSGEAAKQAHRQAVDRLGKLPASRDRVYAGIDLARLLQPVTIEPPPSRNNCLSADLMAQAETLLTQAVDMAQQLQDRRAESFALGAWGHLEECRDHKDQALRLTEQARLAADQSLKAKDSLYLWEWQTGRILNQQGDNDRAIAAYKRAIATLESIRSDILSANRDLQFDFRETIDPIYRELVSLLLEQEQPSQTKANEPPQTDHFKEILGTIDSLQVAELQNYFGNDCVIAAANASSAGANGTGATGDPSAAIIHTFILDDRVAILLTLPNGQTQPYPPHTVKRQALIDQINAFRNGLEAFDDEDKGGYDPKLAQEIYAWLIQPFANVLEAAHIKTLVFVQDGILRSLPMAALHDGKQFLIQKYAIATTPSLSTTNTQPFNRNGLRVLALGLTQAAIVDDQTFPALTNVKEEIDRIQTAIPGSKSLLNDDFTRPGMEKALGQSVFPIIHLATHGNFGADPEETFIVIGQNQKLRLNELDRLIRQTTLNREPLELLALTACETAVGDDRAALGLAGVAIQSGARSALASLWSIDDTATADVAKAFYAKLTDTSLNKAQALQLAQKTLIEQTSITDPRLAHPFYWAPFVLVGNWQ